MSNIFFNFDVKCVLSKYRLIIIDVDDCHNNCSLITIYSIRYIYFYIVYFSTIIKIKCFIRDQ